MLGGCSAPERGVLHAAPAEPPTWAQGCPGPRLSCSATAWPPWGLPCATEAAERATPGFRRVGVPAARICSAPRAPDVSRPWTRVAQCPDWPGSLEGHQPAPPSPAGPGPPTRGPSWPPALAAPPECLLWGLLPAHAPGCPSAVPLACPHSGRHQHPFCVFSTSTSWARQSFQSSRCSSAHPAFSAVSVTASLVRPSGPGQDTDVAPPAHV